jgi:hypothetical protein
MRARSQLSNVVMSGVVQGWPDTTSPLAPYKSPLNLGRAGQETSARDSVAQAVANISASFAEALVPTQKLAEVIPIFDISRRIFRGEAAAISRIKELASESAEDNWDGERGYPIVSRQWDDVRSIVSRALRELPGVPAPFLSACGDGTAHVTWTTAVGNRGVLEVGKSSYWWSYLPISDNYGQDDITQIPTPDVALQKIHSLFG